MAMRVHTIAHTIYSNSAHSRAAFLFFWTQHHCVGIRSPLFLSQFPPASCFHLPHSIMLHGVSLELQSKPTNRTWKIYLAYIRLPAKCTSISDGCVSVFASCLCTHTRLRAMCVFACAYLKRLLFFFAFTWQLLHVLCWLSRASTMSERVSIFHSTANSNSIIGNSCSIPIDSYGSRAVEVTRNKIKIIKRHFSIDLHSIDSICSRAKLFSIQMA